MEQMVIQSLILRPVGTNCLLVMNKETKEMLITDPGDDAAAIMEGVTRFGGNPVAVLLTHGHYDHIMAVEEVRDMFDVPVYAYGDEQEILRSPSLNLSGTWGEGFATKADHLLTDGEKLNMAGAEIEVLHTPGHTKGSCCFYLPQEKVLLSGDTLFAGSVGRMDFPTGSQAQMMESIHKLLSQLPEDTEVYPGHGETTTIGYEKRYNPFA